MSGSAFKYLLAVAVVLCRLSQTSACSCAPPGTLCDSILNTDVVLHVKALERVNGPNINDDVVYTLETIEVFKGEDPGPNEYDEVGGTFEMTTAGNSGLCGVFMDTDGTEYLIDITRFSDGTLYAAGICGLFRVWSEDDRATLEEGCDDYDPCDGECGEFQECARSFDYYAEDSYYCTDTCDPSPCLDGEACTLVYPLCSVAPCIAEATCGEGEPPSPSSPPAETLPPGSYVDSALTLPPGATVDSTYSYVETLAPTIDQRGPPIEPDNGDEPATQPPAPGTAGPPAPTPQTAAPTPAGRGEDQGGPAAAPTLPPPPLDEPTAPNSSEPPTTGRDSSTASPTPSDGSRGFTTAAPSPASTSDAGGASPLPEVSSAPTVAANAEDTDDTGAAAPAVRLSGGFVAATAAAVATAAAACASL